MIIEFSNAKEPRSYKGLSVAIVIASCAFFFIPTTLIVLGYLASRPTGTLISPLPQGVLTQTTPTPSPNIQDLTSNTQDPIIAAPGDSSESADVSTTQDLASNITDKTASIAAGLKEVSITDPDIKSTSQIYLSPRPEDKTIYFVKSKADGQLVIEVNEASDTVRYVDYHIVNP